MITYRRLYSLLLLISLSLSAFEVNAQIDFPYQFNGTKDGIIIGASIGLIGLAEFKYKKIQPLSFEELSRLDRNDVLAIDRSATFNRSIAAKKWSDGLLYSSLAPPLSVLLSGPSENMGKNAALLLETLLVNTALTDITKVLVRRKRPYLYNEFTAVKRKLSKKARMSFFSGHTSTVTAMYFLSAKLYQDLYPDSRRKSTVWMAAVLVPATTGFLRVKAGKHYFLDVLTGFVVGGAIGFLIPEIHKL